MAKGGGGEGHFDERRRAKTAPTGYADSPEVLSAIVKPRAKPAVKKKKAMMVPRAKPSRVEPVVSVERKKTRTLSDWARRLSVGQLGRASEVAVKSQPSAPPIGLGARTAERRMRDPVKVQHRRVQVDSDSGYVPEYEGPPMRPGASAAEKRMRDPVNPDWFRSGALAAELRGSRRR